MDIHYIHLFTKNQNNDYDIIISLFIQDNVRIKYRLNILLNMVEYYFNM